MNLKLFLIDNDDLRRNIFEQMFSDQIYTLNSLEDASFRIPEFNPDLILVGWEIANLIDEEEIQMLSSSQIPFACVCSKEDGERLKEKGWPEVFLELPLEVASLESEIEKLHKELTV